MNTVSITRRSFAPYLVCAALSSSCAPNNVAPPPPVTQTTPVAPPFKMGVPTATFPLDGEKPVTGKGVAAAPPRPAASMNTTLQNGQVEERQGALSATTEVTVLSNATAEYGEPASTLLTGTDGVVQTIVAANVMNSTSGELGRFDYGCFRGSSSSLQCDYYLNNINSGSDPGLVTSSDGFVYMGRMNNNQFEHGLTMYRSSNPCPSTCSNNNLPSWSQCGPDPAVIYDYPMLVHA